MIKSNIVMPRSEMQVYSEKIFIFKADFCFGFDDNKICAVLYEGVETILTFLGDSCEFWVGNTSDLTTLRAFSSS